MVIRYTCERTFVFGTRTAHVPYADGEHDNCARCTSLALIFKATERVTVATQRTQGKPRWKKSGGICQCYGRLAEIGAVTRNPGTRSTGTTVPNLQISSSGTIVTNDESASRRCVERPSRCHSKTERALVAGDSYADSTVIPNRTVSGSLWNCGRAVSG